MDKILKSLLLQTYKPGKGKGKPCRKGTKNTSAGGSQANGKNKPKKRPTKGATKPATDSNYKEGVGVIAHKTNSQELCKFNLEPLSDLQSCKGCGARFDRTISYIPCHADRSDDLHLQSVVKFVTAADLQPDTIV